MKTSVVIAGALLCFGVTAASAQPATQHQHPAGPSSPAQPAMRGAGMPGGVCPMMGAMGGDVDSPKMMQMRGEMMKAMGEIMMKHARKMGGAGAPPRQ